MCNFTADLFKAEENAANWSSKCSAHASSGATGHKVLQRITQAHVNERVKGNKSRRERVRVLVQDGGLIVFSLQRTRFSTSFRNCLKRFVSRNGMLVDLPWDRPAATTAPVRERRGGGKEGVCSSW